MDEPLTTEPTVLRRWQSPIDLRGLLILALVVAGWVTWQTRRAAIQRRAIATIRAAGGSVIYSYQVEADNGSRRRPSNAQPWGPSWLREAIGEDYFQQAKWVFLRKRDRNAWFPANPKLVEAVASLDRAEEFHTYHFPMTDDDLARLSAMSRLKDLSVLDVDLTDDGLAALEKFPALEKLAIRPRKGTITARGLDPIGRQPRIKSLILLGVDLADPMSLAPLAKLTRLENLQLADSPPDDSCLRFLANLTEIKKLDLRRTRLTEAGVNHLLKLVRLETVLFDGSKLSDEGLARLAEFGSLRTMFLDPLPVMSDLGLASLDKLRGASKLELSATNATDEGLAHLKGLTLTSLRVSGRGVTDDGLSRLAATCQVYNLDLSDTGVTGESLPMLANQANLRKLSLAGTAIDDSAAETLAKLPTLETLILNDTPITDAALTALRQSKSLRTLETRGTKVTPQALEAFRKSRSEAAIPEGR